MLERAVDYYRRLNRQGRAEESKSFRVTVTITVLLSVLAAVLYGEVGAPMAVTVFLAVIAGSWFSYRMRNRNNLVVKFVLTVLLLVAFVFFWTELSSSLYDLRYPLVRLFLWLLALHSFDLPSRRDLDFSLVSAAILMAFAGSLSLSTDFLYFLIPFFVLGIASLYLGHRSSLEAGADVFVAGRRSYALRAVALAVAALVPLTVALFVFIPRLPGFNAYYLPMSMMRQYLGDFRGLIRNPGYTDIADEFPDRPLEFDPDSYHGFNEFLDLRVRGVPSDVVVMKVRSSQPAYWRATAFDLFRGNGWENTDGEPQEVESDDLPLPVTYPKGQASYPTRELVQTFFVEKELPNTLFAAYAPRDVFFPSRVLKVDSLLTVLTPVTLSDGLIYTVTSEVSIATPAMLRQASTKIPADIETRYCRLPDMSPRVKELAERVAGGESTSYDKVVAISEYLKENYEYDLGVPPQEDDEDSVEYFLFDEERGFCEHFASALAVMCRTLGIPARLAVGYDSGDLNPLTGYYEVSARDAHAWVEVYFPVYGWIQFDPTPGWSDPQPFSGRGTTWSGMALFDYVGKGLSKLLPAGWGRAIKGAFGAAGRAVGKAASAVASSWRGLLLVFAAALLALFVFVYLRRRRRKTGEEGDGPGGPRRRAADVFERLCAALAAAGVSRAASQTPVEYANYAEARLRVPRIGEAARLFSKARYARPEPLPAEIRRLEGAVEEVVERVNLRYQAGKRRGGKHGRNARL